MYEKPKLISWPTILAAGTATIIAGGVLAYIVTRKTKEDTK